MKSINKIVRTWDIWFETCKNRKNNGSHFENSGSKNCRFNRIIGPRIHYHKPTIYLFTQIVLMTFQLLMRLQEFI